MYACLESPARRQINDDPSNHFGQFQQDQQHRAIGGIRYAGQVAEKPEDEKGSEDKGVGLFCTRCPEKWDISIT